MQSGTSTRVHSTITYSCEDGHVFKTGHPSMTMVCDGNGHWDFDDVNEMATVANDSNLMFLLDDCIGKLWYVRAIISFY